MKVIKYEVGRNILTVGFAESNFIVYTQLANDTTLTKQELLQKAYEQCKPAIDYEKTQADHSFEWDGVGGEEFVPEPPNAKIVELIADRYSHQFEIGQETVEIVLSVEVQDQYGEAYDGVVQFVTTLGSVTGNILTIPKVDVFTKVEVTASCDGVEDTKELFIYPYVEPQIVDEHVDEEIIAMAEAIIDLDSRLSALEGGN